MYRVYFCRDELELIRRIMHTVNLQGNLQEMLPVVTQMSGVLSIIDSTLNGPAADPAKDVREGKD